MARPLLERAFDMPRRCIQFLCVAASAIACGDDDDDGGTSIGTAPPATDDAGDDDPDSGDDDAASDGDPDSSDGGTELECTFPDDPSICGCGNECVGDGADYGLCRECGPEGSGCDSDYIYCCADADCPSGTRCSTLSSSPNVGYHLCLALEPCEVDADCFLDEPCEQGYCRDPE